MEEIERIQNFNKACPVKAILVDSLVEFDRFT